MPAKDRAWLEAHPKIDQPLDGWFWPYGLRSRDNFFIAALSLTLVTWAGNLIVGYFGSNGLVLLILAIASSIASMALAAQRFRDAGLSPFIALLCNGAILPIADGVGPELTGVLSLSTLFAVTLLLVCPSQEFYAGSVEDGCEEPDERGFR